MAPSVLTMSPLPPALESTVQLKPAVTTLLRAVWSQLIVPKLPTYLGSWFVHENAGKVWTGWSTYVNVDDDVAADG
jgi:hypothetical protein